MKRIGIYSGTFAPVHNGHLSFCLKAVKKCALDKVILLPEREPRNKTDVTPLRHRQAMLELATKDQKELEVRIIDQPQFTVRHTLPLLYQYYPDSTFVLMFGSDVVRGFLSAPWPDMGELFDSASLAIGMRETDRQGDIAAQLRVSEKDFGITIDYTFISVPDARASSTTVREAPLLSSDIARGSAEYIILHKLYGTDTSSKKSILL